MIRLVFSLIAGAWLWCVVTLVVGSFILPKLMLNPWAWVGCCVFCFVVTMVVDVEEGKL